MSDTQSNINSLISCSECGDSCTHPKYSKYKFCSGTCVRRYKDRKEQRSYCHNWSRFHQALKISEPKVSEPKVSDPNVSETNVLEPGVSEPGVSEPGVSLQNNQ